jgi:hypothetical protein
VLVLHGLLHLAGYDHEIDDGKMARRERQLRARLKLPQGLIERSTIAPCPILSAAVGGEGGKPQSSTRGRVPQISNLRPGKPPSPTRVPLRRSARP